MSALKKVDRLIALMDETKPLSQRERDRLSRKHRRRATQRMLDEEISYGQASGAPEFLLQDRRSFDRLIRETDQDLGWQCDTVSEAFGRYIETGEVPAPHYPMRIAILLRKAKEAEREYDFLGAWCRHFPTGPGATYGKLVERRRKAKEPSG